MSRTSNCIRMLMLLYTRDVVSISYIANALETNARNIPEYRDELEMAGYKIDTVKGRCGGYRLNKNTVFPTVRLTESEKKALAESFDYVTKRGEFPLMPSFVSAMERVLSTNNIRSTDDEEMLVLSNSNRTLLMPEKDIQERYAAVSQCIEEYRALKISYRSNDNVVRERTIHPYKLYMYNNAWFVLAYCESTGDLRYFKLVRMTEFEATSKKFSRLYGYREGSEWHEWLDGANGMKQNRDWYRPLSDENIILPIRIKLKLTGLPAMYAKEYRYGNDQTITEVDKDTTILECTTRYAYNTVQLVLGFGSDCEVLEPLWLKKEIIAQCEKILGTYNTEGEK